MRWLTLLSFIAGAVGVPLEPLALWGAAPSCAKRPGKACRCSAISRSLGRCCCAKGQAEKSAAQCQVTTPKRSCCASKAPAKSEPDATKSTTTAAVSMEACGCGPSSSAWLLLCGDPRVTMNAPELTVNAPPLAALTTFDLSPRGERARPDLPPPKSLPA